MPNKRTLSEMNIGSAISSVARRPAANEAIERLGRRPREHQADQGRYQCADGRPHQRPPVSLHQRGFVVRAGQVARQRECPRRHETVRGNNTDRYEKSGEQQQADG
jgi:hypothetical protein